MIRGTTAQFKIKLPYPKDELDWITIAFWQSGNPIFQSPIVKNQSHCETTDKPNEICVSLSSNETAAFSDKYKAKMQLRAQPLFGAPFGSREQLITVYPMRDDIIDDDIIIPTPPTEDDWIILDGEAIVDV